MRRLERRLDLDLLERQVAQRLVGDQHRGLASAARNSPRRRRAVAQHGQMAGHERVVDDGHSVHARARYSLGAGERGAPQRRAEGARSRPGRDARARARPPAPPTTACSCQRDTYFRVAPGRLKLREEEPGEAHLIAYARPTTPRCACPRTARDVAGPAALPPR